MTKPCKPRYKHSIALTKYLLSSVLSLPTELILTIIHDVYFPLSRHSTPEPDEFTALQSSSCVHRLLSERDIGELVADAFRRTVARVTLEATATRFIQLFSDKPQLSCAFAACHLDMMASACCLPALTRHLQSRGGHKVATRAIWRLLRTEPTQADDWALSGEALVRMLARHVHIWFEAALILMRPI